MDVVVIGGSISGLMFAKHLSKLGATCTVLEKEKGVGNKACGEGVDESILKNSSFLDLYGSKEGVTKSFDRFIFQYRDRAYHSDLKVTMINRKKVESELLRQVRKSGVEVRFGENVSSLRRVGNKIKLAPQDIEASMVVGADGAQSKTRDFIGVEKPRLGTAITTKVEMDHDLPHIFFEKGLFGFYWIFPNEGYCNVGVGRLVGKGQDLKGKLSEFLSERGYKMGEVSGAYVPSSRPVRCYDDNVILIGDSASQICPFTGGGIPAASSCAKLGADVAKSALDRREFSAEILSRYEELCEKEVYPSLWMRRILSNLLSFSCRHDITMRFFSKWIS